MDKVFSLRIKELRTIYHQTQSEFADFIGTTQSALSGYENGDRTPSYEILLAIAKKCNVSIDWLCGLSDKMALDDRITKYKELFTAFINVLDTKYIEGGYCGQVIWDDIIIDREDHSVPFSRVTITLTSDTNFDDFFGKWKKIAILHNSGDVDDDLYQMWLNKQLKEYDSPIDGLPSFMHD